MVSPLAAVDGGAVAEGLAVDGQRRRALEEAGVPPRKSPRASRDDEAGPGGRNRRGRGRPPWSAAGGRGARSADDARALRRSSRAWLRLRARRCASERATGSSRSVSTVQPGPRPRARACAAPAR